MNGVYRYRDTSSNGTIVRHGHDETLVQEAEVGLAESGALQIGGAVLTFCRGSGSDAVTAPPARAAGLAYDRAFLAGRGLDLDLAFQCVELAWLVYRDPGMAHQRALHEFGYESYRHLSRRHGRDHAFVVRDKLRTIVAFRGSDDPWDWLTNLRAWMAQTPLGHVHRGYYDVLRSLADELRELLEDDPRRRPVVFTGHSMGGALAVLAGATFGADAIGPAGIYTFGQPQVGGRDFTKHFSERCPAPLLRFVNGADAIAVWSYGRHSLLGTTCYFDRRGYLVFGDHFSEVPRLGLRFHRLDHYRYHLRLNRLRLRLLDETDEATVLVER